DTLFPLTPTLSLGERESPGARPAIARAPVCRMMGNGGSSMVPLGKPWVIVRSCPPHPNPLPKERENYRQSLPHRRRLHLGTESAAPSPWGSLGRGVGVRGNGIDARQRIS